MKKYIAALLALVMILSFAACGDKGEDVTGKYICVGEAYGTNPYSPPFGESWLELKKGGKGIYLSSFEFDIKWELDGEAFVGTVTFMEMEDQMTGTLKDGVIEVTYGDKRMRFVKEGVEAPTDTGEGSAPSGGGESVAAEGIVGYYPVSSAVIDGEEWTISDLRVFEMADSTFLQLNADGTGVLGIFDEEPVDITYDEDAGTIVHASGETFNFTVDGDTITIVFPEDGSDGTTINYTRDGSVAPSAGSSGSEAAGDTFSFDSVTVAPFLEDAFAGAAPGGEYGDEYGWDEFVSTTTSLELGSKWYGVMEFSNFVGVDSEDYAVDVVAQIDETNQGNAYFELYNGREIDADATAISFYIDLYDDYFEAATELGDCWVLAEEMTEEDEIYFSPSLINGSLEILYDYYQVDEGTGCTVRIFLREDGAQWDEANDPLPPSYEDYKAEIGA